MKTKKLFSVFLIFILLILSACGKENEGNGYDITGSYDPMKYVELGDYKNLSMDVTVTDEELQEEINGVLEMNQKYEEIHEGEAKNGDAVNIDYEGSVDGVAFSGGTAEDFVLELGSGEFIAGFEEQVVGHKVGEEFTINVTFPEEYFNEEMAGKAAEFKVKLNYIRGEAIPTEFNDEFVKSLEEGYETVEDYKAYLLDTLKSDKKKEELDKLFTQVVESSNIKDYPSNILDVVKVRFETTNQMAIEYQFESMEKYLEMYGMTQEDYDKYLSDSIKEYVRDLMISEAIAKEEKIEISEEEYKEMMDTYLENHQKESEEELAKYFQEEYHANLKDIIHETLINEKVMEYLESQAEVKE